MVSRVALLLALLASSPAAAQTTARDIAETADISGVAASPDAEWIVYRIERPSTLTNRIDVDWYIVAADGLSAPRALGRTGTAMWDDAGVVLAGEAKWAPDSRTLVVRALVDGQIALWSSDVAGSGFRPIVASVGDIEAFAFAADGSLITSEGPARDTLARAEDAERESGILVDGNTDLAQPLYHGASINGRPSTQRFSGDWFDRSPLLASEPRRVTARLAAGPVRAATADEKALIAPPPHPALLKLDDLPVSLRMATKPSTGPLGSARPKPAARPISRGCHGGYRNSGMEVSSPPTTPTTARPFGDGPLPTSSSLHWPRRMDNFRADDIIFNPVPR